MNIKDAFRQAYREARQQYSPARIRILYPEVYYAVMRVRELRRRCPIILKHRLEIYKDTHNGLETTQHHTTR